MTRVWRGGRVAVCRTAKWPLPSEGKWPSARRPSGHRDAPQTQPMGVMLSDEVGEAPGHPRRPGGHWAWPDEEAQAQARVHSVARGPHRRRRDLGGGAYTSGIPSRTAAGRAHLRLRGRAALLRRAGRPASAGAERPFGIAAARSETDLATGGTAKWPPPRSPAPPPPPARPERVQPPPCARIHARDTPTSAEMPRRTASAECFEARLAASPSETNTTTRWPRVVKAMR